MSRGYFELILGRILSQRSRSQSYPWGDIAGALLPAICLGYGLKVRQLIKYARMLA